MKSETKTPFVAIALKVLGWILIVASLVGLVAAVVDSVAAALAVSLGSLASSVLAFGFAAAIIKLYQIESHLRPPADADARTERAGNALGL